ncbi:MAG TPA: MFS transporter [Rubricoccaceae bacterium]|jgi:UMF1 family MFS transporter
MELARPAPRSGSSARTVWAWALYDFANSSFTTLIVTFVYATYFTKGLVLGADGLPDEIAGSALWSRGVGLTAFLVAVLSPFLGAVADRTGTRRTFLIATTAVCIAATVGLFFPLPGQALAALALFVVANVAFELSGVFYNAFLPEIAPPESIGKISGNGWALGYVGGLLALVLALFLLVLPEAPVFGLDKATGANIRAVCLLVGAWYAVFSIPAFLALKNDRVTDRPGTGAILRATAGELAQTFREMRRFRDAFRFLVARLFFNDGLNTVFAFGGIYAAGTFGFTTTEIITFGIALNLAAGAGAFGFGFVDDRLGGKRTILISLVLLAAATTLGVFAPSRAWFWVAGIGIGLAAGPNQAASRSLIGRFTPPDKENEFYGFFALTGKAAAFAGPLLFGVLTEAFESQRAGVASVLLFFLVGGLLLLRVDERAGIVASGRGA